MERLMTNNIPVDLTTSTEHMHLFRCLTSLTFNIFPKSMYFQSTWIGFFLVRSSIFVVDWHNV